MKSYLLSLLAFLGLLPVVSGQRPPDLDRITDSIVAEGKRLYASERTSWDGTDLFLAKFSDREKLGGYFSYADGDSFRCVFYSRDASPRVLGSVSFDSAHDAGKARVDLAERDFAPLEQPIYRIRAKALAIIKTDTFFKSYQKTDLNLIPLVGNGERRVVVLTGAQEGGVVLIGNDYELRFDGQDQLISKKRLHHNILALNYGGKGGQESIGGVHSHLDETGPYITATDICTLMLYEKMAKWQSHVVVSQNFVSIWNCENDRLVILTQEAWKRIQKDQKKHN
jgi:hypothetical protein